MSFYTDNPLKTWQQVLGPKMHYHFGSYSDDDIFDQTIRNLYPYIDNNSSILDVGCGWGGPARLLTNEKQCKCHGVTNSKQQYDNYPYTVSLSNANYYTPDDNYDIAIFIESLTHFSNASEVLSNIRPHTKKIIIRDFLSDDDWYNDEWYMHFRTFNSFTNLVSKHYNITHIEEDNQSDVYNSGLYWYNNISKLNPNQITSQVKSLHDLCGAILNGGQAKLITIVAE